MQFGHDEARICVPSSSASDCQWITSELMLTVVCLLLQGEVCFVLRTGGPGLS